MPETLMRSLANEAVDGDQFTVLTFSLAKQPLLRTTVRRLGFYGYHSGYGELLNVHELRRGD